MQITSTKLRGKKIAVLAADGFEHVELSIPEKALRLAGADVEIVSLHPGRIRGMNMTAPTKTVRVDRTIDEVSVDEYDALFVPGGFIGPDLLRQSGPARRFVAAFDAAQKPIATLCHGPWMFASAGIARGRTLASWPGVRDDLVHAGATWRDEPVVRDRNWITSRGPQDLKQFVPAMLALFADSGLHAEDATAHRLQTGSSPAHESPPPMAVAVARMIPGPTIRTVAAAAAVAAVGALALRAVSA
ncbi:type 1 glutamine amidotransferase domain-containing protein [Sandaracinus amylolyticus]|nr:type 1 glutamine amidotransferase domain-containing protein [Sandaracinus amylolyticus]